MQSRLETKELTHLLKQNMEAMGDTSRKKTKRRNLSIISTITLMKFMKGMIMLM
jgi:hypothetical protein